MKIVRLNNGYRIRCTDHEMAILETAVDQIECGETLEFLDETGLRRSWARRTNAGAFMRIDEDRRTEA